MLQSLVKGQHLVWPIVAVCVFVLVLNNLYRWPLYYMGIQLIKSMQSAENTFLNIIFLSVTMILDPTVVFAVCVLMLILTHNKAKGFVMILFVLFNTYCAAVLKALNSDPRPIWTDKDVRSLGLYCPRQYGNPSGHSWFSAVFGFGILLDYKGAGKNYINVWISIAAVILMPISRMYLGAHSLNQVLEGLVLGLSVCLLYLTKLKSLILKYLSQISKNNIWLYVIGLMHIIYLIPFVAHRKQQLPAEWQANILLKCQVVMNEQKLNCMMLLANALFVNLITGIGYGYKLLSSTEMGKHYLTGSWQINEQKYQITKGYVYLVAVQCVCLLSGLVIAGALYQIPNIIVRFIGVTVGGFVSGYIYTSKSCQILNKYRIIREVIV